jgi:hypothetical protein
VIGAHCIGCTLPALFIVASSARLGFELTVMDIFVAAVACGKGYAFPFCWRAMALFAGYWFVFAKQWIGGELMIKLVVVKLIEVSGVMAVLTLSAKLIFMRIFVTAGTCETGAQKLRFAQRRNFGMALETSGGGVITLQLPSGLVVIKRFHLAAWTADQFGASTQVLNVTLFAWFSIGLFAVPALSSAHPNP